MYLTIIGRGWAKYRDCHRRANQLSASAFGSTNN